MASRQRMGEGAGTQTLVGSSECSGSHRTGGNSSSLNEEAAAGGSSPGTGRTDGGQVTDSTSGRRKYYRPKSAEDRRRRDQERVLKNRELANIANANRKRKMEEMLAENKSLKAEAEQLEKHNLQLTQLKSRLQHLRQQAGKGPPPYQERAFSRSW